MFIDMTGSTALAEQFDPELIRRILDRYHSTCAAAVAEHGGVVEKYIGDAVMAAFGVPLSHEDDAERAVRAACSAREAIGELDAELRRTHNVSLGVHCGIAAGEAIIVEGTPADLRVIGDVVNTASRLQGAAADGDIVISDEVARFVRPVAELEELPPLSLRGKQGRVSAWRLLAMRDRRPPDDDAHPLVNRTEEIGQLHQAYHRALQGRQCCLVTLLGPAGIGKSRVARSFVQSLGEGTAEPRVVTTECPPYSAGATYRPLVQLLESLNGEWQDTAESLDRRSVQVLRAIAATAGPRDTSRSGIEEVTHAVRSLLEHMARTRPLVIVVDDAHWAEETFLDLLQETATWIVDAPVLLLCLARGELLDRRPAWGGGMACAVTLELGPLADGHIHDLLVGLHAGLSGDRTSAEVVAHGDEQLCRKAARYSDGNPLIGELILHRLVEGGIDAEVPSTVQALVGARLDQLGPVERDILERAATAGQTFGLDRVVRLLGPGADRFEVEQSLRRLVRRRMLRRSTGPGRYAFTQTLTREIAYSLASKAARAEWHLTLADAPGTAAASQEPLFDGMGHGDRTRHLEAACRLKLEVMPDDPTLPGLAVRAARALIADGSQALYRKDLAAATTLLERGRALLPAGHPDHRLLALRSCDAALARGARSKAEEALDIGRRMLPDDRRAALTFRIQQQILAVRHGEHVPAVTERGDLLTGAADDLTWCRLHQLEMLRCAESGRFGAAERALQAALARSASFEDRYEADRLLSGLCELTQWSPTPIPDALAHFEAAIRAFGDDRTLLVPVLLARARLSAQAGELADANGALRSATRYAEELHLNAAAPLVCQVRGIVESLAGRHDIAHRQFRRAAASLRSAGQPGVAFTLGGYAAHELLRQGRTDAASDALAALEVPLAPQFRGELLHLALRARLASLSGRHGEAVSLADQLRSRVEATDDPCLRGDALADIARVHREAGAPARCRDAAGAAIDMYQAKGALLLVRRAVAEFGPREGAHA